MGRGGLHAGGVWLPPPLSTRGRGGAGPARFGATGTRSAAGSVQTEAPPSPPRVGEGLGGEAPRRALWPPTPFPFPPGAGEEPGLPGSARPGSVPQPDQFRPKRIPPPAWGRDGEGGPSRQALWLRPPLSTRGRGGARPARFGAMGTRSAAGSVQTEAPPSPPRGGGMGRGGLHAGGLCPPLLSKDRGSAAPERFSARRA